MKILFVTIHFGEYINEIVREMKNNGNSVDIIYTDNYLINPAYFIYKITKGRFQIITDIEYQKRKFAKYEKENYDVIFTLVGRGIDEKLFGNFLQSQKKAYKVLYLWDDVKRISEFERIKKFYDKIYSFDPKDCERYGFTHFPLFYCNQFRYPLCEKDIDLTCIGGLHSDRYNVLCELKNQFKNYNAFFYLKTTFLHFLKILLDLREKNISIIHFKRLTLKKTAEITLKSNVMVDLPFESQTGLTIRTFEAMAAHTKLATTNADIINYDFYNPANIIIIDRTKAEIPKDFLKSQFQSIPLKIMEKYSIKSWVNTIISKEE